MAAFEARDRGVEVQLLGGFGVSVGSREVAPGAWPSRRAAELVQLLALADDHRLTRDQVIEALWPRLEVEAGGANLRKAAHHARKALGTSEAVVLRGGVVAFFPSRSVRTDAAEFEARSDAALAGGDAEACAAVADSYGGDLLPDALYEDWTQTARERLRSRYLELLRHSDQWERVVETDPTDEPAHRELMSRELEAGSRPGAIRWYGRLRAVLRRELGLLPSDETRALYERCIEGLEKSEPELVGRELELATATGALKAALGGELAAIVVRGPAGIGKSAFCRELGRLAQGEDWKVVPVAATETGGPYEPLVAAAEQLLAPDRDRLLGAVGEEARSVLAELTSLAAPAEPLESPLSRHRVIGAVRRLLLAASGDGPVLFVVDDAHLADEATIEILGHLGSSGGTPVLALLAYRPEAAPEALVRGMSRLGRAGQTVELDLEPLQEEDAVALVAAGTSAPRTEEVVERIVALAQGNPFLTLELARSAVAGVPALVATAGDAIVSRLIGLDDDTIAMLRRLAVAGDDLDPAAVVALTEASEAEAFGLLDEALTTGVLVVVGARYRFRHDLVRQALVEQLPPHQRLEVHRETAQRLAAADGPPALIARHWLAGERPEEAADWLLSAAGEAVELGAYADALAQLEPLLEQAPDHVDALVLRAEALDARGDPGALAAYDAAADAVGDPAAQDLRAKRALATIKRGDPAGALEAIKGVEPATLDGRIAQALTYCGAAVLGFGDAEIGTEKAAEARRLALESGDPSAVVIASWAQAGAAHARGELRESVMADLRETESVPELAVNVFDGQLCITQRFLYGARPYADVIAFTESLAAEAERRGAARGRAFAVTLRGEAKLLSGELEEADADLAEGARLQREIGAGTGEAFATQRRAEVAMHRGRREQAKALLDEALAIARESDVGFHLLDRIYGTRIALAEDPEAALAALEEAEEAVRGPIETCPGCRITLAAPAAIAAARAGEIGRAAEWEQEVEFLAGTVMRLPAWDAAFDEVKGHRAQAEGDLTSARERFAAAAKGFADAGQPLDEARCRALADSLEKDAAPAPGRAAAS